MSNKLLISIYSHEDEFIELLYDSNREFEGQIISPRRTINKNGTQSLSFEIPIRIYDRSKNDFVENPRWDYIIHQYKIRIEQDDEINEFVCNGYTESRNESNQVTVEVDCIGLAEFELAQVGYSLTFGEQTLNIYEEGVDPNDPNAVPIGTESGDINFWENKLIQYLNAEEAGEEKDNIVRWDYRIESYYPIDESDAAEGFVDNRTADNFYENDRIIGYYMDTEGVNGNPIKDPEGYQVRSRIISVEKSSIWNIQQEICEKFECWPVFEFEYEDGKIVKKWIVLKNDLPEEGSFTIQYRKNLKNITREVDSSQIITKMYVTPVENENMDSGIVSIADNESNSMGEDYILDLSWYLKDDGTFNEENPEENEGLINRQLINPNLSYTFKPCISKGETFDDVNPTGFTFTNTQDVYFRYKQEIKYLNEAIKTASFAESTASQALLNLITERDLALAEKDAAQESANKATIEWEKCREKYLNKDSNLSADVNLSVQYIKETGKETKYIVDLPYDGITKQMLDNAMQSDEILLTNMTLVNNDTELIVSPYKTEPITNTILSISLDNVKIIDEDKTMYIEIPKLQWNPLLFHDQMRQYYLQQVNEHKNYVDSLGKTKSEYGEEDGYDEDEKPIPKAEKDLKEAQANRMRIQNYKYKLTREIEKLFAPFVKEGYWEDTKYSMYPSVIEDPIRINNNEENGALRYDLAVNKTQSSYYNWEDNFLCFPVEDRELVNENGEYIYTANGKKVTLYDVMDLSTIEVYNKDPFDNSNAKPLYEFVNTHSTDRSTSSTYDVGYGVAIIGTDLNTIKTTYAVGSSNVNVEQWIKGNAPAECSTGVFVKVPRNDNFYDGSWQLTTDNKIYIRVKPFGSNTDYIKFKKGSNYNEYIELQPFGSANTKTFYCDFDRVITLDKRNIILTSIDVKLHTGKLAYEKDSKGVLKLKGTIEEEDYTLVYGRDYWTNKDFKYVLDENGVLQPSNLVVGEVHLIYSPYSPLLKFNKTNEIDLNHGRASYYEVDFKVDASAAKYYKDALESMRDYRKPRVDYHVDIQDISQAYHYAGKYLKPVVGSKVRIWDKEMRFEGAKGIINTITEDLVNPQNNSIDVSSYKNKFEDLFQKITAATVAVETKEYNYDRSAELTDTVYGKQKTLNLMQNALKEADAALALSPDNEIVTDASGITVTNKETNENGVLGKLRITSNGLFVSNEQDSNGNYLWSTAITPDFINADLIRAGHIDTRSISIWNDAQPTFLWDEEGINAFGKYGNTGISSNVNQIDKNTYVKYNYEGLKFRKKEKYAGDTQTLTNIYQENQHASDYSIKLTSTNGVEANKKYFYYVCWNIAPNTENKENIKASVGIPGNYSTYTCRKIDTNEDGDIYECEAYGYLTTNNTCEIDIDMITTNTGEVNNPNITMDKCFVCKVDDVIQSIINNNDENNSDFSLAYNLEIWDESLRYKVKKSTGNTITLNANDNETYIYYDSVNLGWDGFLMQSLSNKVKLDESGLVVGETKDKSSVIVGNLTNGKYGILGHDKYGKQVFRLDEDGLILSGDFSGSNLYGGSLNIGGFYENRALDPRNVGYNFQVDELGRVKARAFELYPRAGVTKESTFATVAYSNYRGVYKEPMRFSIGDVIYDKTNYYKIIKLNKDRSIVFTDLDSSKINVEKLIIKNYNGTSMNKGDYFINENKLYKVITSWSGSPISFKNNAKNYEKINFTTYTNPESYYMNQVFSYMITNENTQEKITKYYVVLKDFTNKNFNELTSNDIKEIEIKTSNFKKGDIRIGNDYKYYMATIDGAVSNDNNWEECYEAYGEGAGVEFDKPFAKVVNNNGNYGLMFYDNAIYQPSRTSDYQNKLSYFGNDKAVFYDDDKEHLLINSWGMRLINTQNDTSNLDGDYDLLAIGNSGIDLYYKDQFKTSLNGTGFTILSSNAETCMKTNSLSFSVDQEKIMLLNEDQIAFKNKTIISSFGRDGIDFYYFPIERQLDSYEKDGGKNDRQLSKYALCNMHVITEENGLGAGMSLKSRPILWKNGEDKWALPGAFMSFQVEEHAEEEGNIVTTSPTGEIIFEGIRYIWDKRTISNGYIIDDGLLQQKKWNSWSLGCNQHSEVTPGEGLDTYRDNLVGFSSQGSSDGILLSNRHNGRITEFVLNPCGCQIGLENRTYEENPCGLKVFVIDEEREGLETTYTSNNIFTANMNGAFYSSNQNRLIASENIGGNTMFGGTTGGETGIASVRALRYIEERDNAGNVTSQTIQAYCLNENKVPRTVNITGGNASPQPGPGATGFDGDHALTHLTIASGVTSDPATEASNTPHPTRLSIKGDAAINGVIRLYSDATSITENISISGLTGNISASLVELGSLKFKTSGTTEKITGTINGFDPNTFTLNASGILSANGGSGGGVAVFA